MKLVLLPCSISRSGNEATSWTQFIVIVQSKRAGKNSTSRPVSTFWKKCILFMLHGRLLAESFFLRVVAHKFQRVTLVKRMYKHQQTLATLQTGKKNALNFVLSAQIIPHSEGVVIINNNCCHIFNFF